MPEVASRAHLDLLNPVIARAIVEAGVDEQRIDAVACTIGPGLIGALLVGRVGGQGAGAGLGRARSSASTTSRRTSTRRSSTIPTVELPIVVLLVSGGHTMLVEMRAPGDYRLLGQTIDDAAGEAFDKVARFLGLGYPGGPAIERDGIVGRPGGDRVPPGDAQRRARLQLLRAQDVGGQLRPQAPRGRRGRRGGVVPGRPSSTCSSRRPDGLPRQVGARGIALGGGVAANSHVARRAGRRAAPRTALRSSCRAGRCAPTTRR